ncbi:hypothetical protein [Acinetobacter guerrae]|uniref:hypothetical protein n=1 Tax=Acinetobacter guerrae TaxID=1843371 RepID=UPI00126005B7|nr:hypothetical protein [Acinetobacter guerrae]
MADIYGMRCWDLAGNLIVDITTALSNLFGSVTIPKNNTGIVSGTVSNPLPQSSRFFYIVTGNTIPLNAIAVASPVAGKTVNVSAFDITISIDSAGVISWSALNRWGYDLGLTDDVKLHFGCY